MTAGLPGSAEAGHNVAVTFETQHDLGPALPQPAWPPTGPPAGIDLDVLDEIQRRVLWLAVRIVDAANHERATGDGVKVGGHQASRPRWSRR